MTAEPAAIIDTTTVTSTRGVIGTGVANTQQLLPGIPGPAGPPAQKAAQQLAAFTTNGEILRYCRLIVRNYLGYKDTEVHRFADSQKHTPTPHKGLVDCGFGAWTNSSKRVYIFEPQLEQIRDASSAEEQRVLAWIVLYHETLHVKKFKSDWKGSHPPSFTAGFIHEAETYKGSAKWLRNPTDRRFTVLLGNPAAKAACKAAARQHSDISKAMHSAIAGAPSDPAKHEAYYYDLLKSSDSVPPALKSLPPAKALKASYGY